MYHINPKTLSYHKQLLARRKLSVSDIRLPDFVKSVWEYRDGLLKSGGSDNVYVEDTAAEFYLYNHVFSMLGEKYHDDEVMDEIDSQLARKCSKALARIGRRLVSYTLLVCTRESRHLSGAPAFSSKLKKKHPLYHSFRNSLPHSSDGAVDKLFGAPPDMPLGEYCSAMRYVFNSGGFSSGYGGKPWGNIAGTLEKYVDGDLTLEGFVDVAWSLAHNNGPMFNKGIFYQHYSSDLIKLLDVQASGQRPHLLADLKRQAYGMTNTMNAVTTFENDVLPVFPELEHLYVDWFAVEELNYHGNQYPSYKHKQIALYGDPTDDSKEVVAGEYHIMPGVTAKIIKRAA